MDTIKDVCHLNQHRKLVTVNEASLSLLPQIKLACQKRVEAMQYHDMLQMMLCLRGILKDDGHLHMLMNNIAQVHSLYWKANLNPAGCREYATRLVADHDALTNVRKAYCRQTDGLMQMTCASRRSVLTKHTPRTMPKR